MRLKWYDIPVIAIFFPVFVIAMSIAAIFAGLNWLLRRYFETLNFERGMRWKSRV